MAELVLSPQPLQVVERVGTAGARDDAHPLWLSLTADALRRYPGESVTLFLRLDAPDAAAADLAIRLTVPPGLQVEHFHMPAGLPVPTSVFFGDDACPGQILIWETASLGRSGLDLEITATVAHDVARIAARAPDRRVMMDGEAMPAPVFALDCVAEAEAQISGVRVRRSQALALEVSPKARYLKHLPGIYESDELMSRLLMLFESFWAPIEQQITNIHYYLDPRMTPARLLPWLASWADWVMDERWSETQQRRLVQALVSLYRRRGTPRGLREMLALYTGLDPDSDAIEIVEHRANNFVLGAQACLGPSVALGTRNIAHTFSVQVRLPPLSRVRPDLTPAEIEREEMRRRRMLEEIIEMEKPAHTQATLHIVLEDER